MNAMRRQGREDEAAGLLADQASPMPLYHRLYAILRSQISDAVYRRGDLLPSEAALMQSFGVSRITAKRALDELSAEGLVERARGRGTVVTQAVPVGSSPIEGRLDDLLQNLASIGRGSSVRLLEFDYVAPPALVAEKLRLEGGLVQRAVRLRHVDGVPISLLTSYIIESVGRSFDGEAMNATPVFELLARAGMPIDSAEQSVTATLADAVSAAHLAVPAGSPLLMVKRVLFGPGGRPVEYLEGLYPPDRFEFRMTLPAPRGAATFVSS
jgi:GntR family transcriptional regulator